MHAMMQALEGQKRAVFQVSLPYQHTLAVTKYSTDMLGCVAWMFVAGTHWTLQITKWFHEIRKDTLGSKGGMVLSRALFTKAHKR